MSEYECAGKISFGVMGNMYVAIMKYDNEDGKEQGFPIGAINYLSAEENPELKKSFIKLMEETIRHMIVHADPDNEVVFGQSSTEAAN